MNVRTTVNCKKCRGEDKSPNVSSYNQILVLSFATLYKQHHYQNRSKRQAYKIACNLHSRTRPLVNLRRTICVIINIIASFFYQKETLFITCFPVFCRKVIEIGNLNIKLHGNLLFLWWMLTIVFLFNRSFINVI